MAALNEVKSWMAFYGWTKGGEPGSVKIGATGAPISDYGDCQWESDLHMAIARCVRDRVDRDLMDEFEGAKDKP